MNFDICKNCLRKSSFYIIVSIEEDYFILEGNTNACLIAIKRTNKTKFLEEIDLERMKFNAELLKNFEIEIWNGCPYFMEHMISEWNKNES